MAAADAPAARPAPPRSGLRVVIVRVVIVMLQIVSIVITVTVVVVVIVIVASVGSQAHPLTAPARGRLPGCPAEPEWPPAGRSGGA